MFALANFGVLIPGYLSSRDTVHISVMGPRG